MTTNHVYGGREQDRGKGRERGSAMIAALLIVSMVAMLGLSMLSAGVSGSKLASGQTDEYRLTSAVESVGTLAAENLWSGYLRAQGGAPGTIATFRAHLNGLGIADNGAGGPPTALQGVDLLAASAIPGADAGRPRFDDVSVDALRAFRRDEGESTRLYVTVSATTLRGEGVVSDPIDRAIQLVYTVEPAAFEGFDYGILTKNVNCVFCHTVVDNAERVYNLDPTLYDSFAKVKVGTLESLMLRTNNRPDITDSDADSMIAGSLYVRGTATNQNGVPIANWTSNVEMHSCLFDSDGHLVQDDWGGLASTVFHPAGNPPQPGENLYLDYPTVYSEMPDGKLPTTFPPPFPDDGGIDPATGEPTTAGANNHVVDPNEFHAVAQHADGTIASGVIEVVPAGTVIDDAAEYMDALHTGNQTSLSGSTTGNVVLTGTQANPIVISGTVAIDGDLVISGWVKGKGTILASGNVYVPSSLQYLDGHVALENDPPGAPSGPQTFGIAQDGTQNVLGLAAGGNVLIGDYLAPSVGVEQGPDDFVGGGLEEGWNFTLAEISIFNRTEWARTQPLLPGPGENPADPSTWTVQNPSYFGATYVPHYYQFGPGDEIPIYNLGSLHFNPATGTWNGPEVPGSWNPQDMTILDPSDHSNPLLYDPATGAPRASILQVASSGGWLSDAMQEVGLSYFEGQHPQGEPVQIDGLLYTNHAIFGIVRRDGPAQGQLEVNGSLVCADLGLLSPGIKVGTGHPGNVPGSPYKAGLRINYDKRTRGMLNVTNPNSVTIRRTLWNPTANVL